MKLLLSFFIVLMLPALGHATELTIGLIPEQNVFKQVARYEPLGQYIEQKTGIKIKFTILSRYGNIIERFHQQNLDGAFWGSFTGALAIRKLGIDPIARPVNPDGSSTYHGYILVHQDSSIRTAADMKGKTVAFVEKATTAGYIFPMAYFKENGITNIDTYFKEYYFTGSHDAAIHAVMYRKVDIACAKNTIFDVLAEQDPRIREQLTIIARSPNVPSNGLGLREEIAFGVKAELKKALLEMDKDPTGRAVLKTFGALKFIETSEEDYAPVFEIAAKAGIRLRDYVYENK